MFSNNSLTFLFFFTFLLFFSCTQKKTELLWNQSLYQIGSQSSPRATDLTGDGILDIVMGAGTAEMAPTDMGVIALDGATGQLLWQQKASASIVGSAIFHDLNEDGTDDVFIGGRGANLMALDGKTGAIIWKYEYNYEDDPILQFARFNFYNSAFIADQNNDGHPELLCINGGNWDAAANENSERFPGVLLLFDSKTGDIIVADTMPDGKESYMSPIAFQQEGNQGVNILLGTGGETAGGNLYLTTVEDLLNKDLAKAKIIAFEKAHGFIAPPVMADITMDGLLDIVAISHAGKAFAIDGKSYSMIWERKFNGMEANTSFAVGHFNSDDIPDFVTTANKGVWPDYHNSHHFILDGKDGGSISEIPLGCFSLASSVVYDLDRDGQDEFIISINDFDCSFKRTDDNLSPKHINNQLLTIDLQRPNPQVVDQANGFKNIYSTPWIGDLDQDGFLDIVYCQYYDPQDFVRFVGMQVKRVSTAIPMKNEVLWGEYMGPGGKGIFPL